MNAEAPIRLTSYSHGAGCGCKLSPTELRHVLAGIPGLCDERVLLGAGDDAALYRIDADRALVATVDFFTPVVDDPETFGAIAAANSVSDVYAMGGTPLFALSLVAFPRELLDTGLIERIVRGGADRLAAAGIAAIGGHSIDDPEPKFGYAVVGEVDPANAVTQRGARPGDSLYLTKPLCSGVVTTALKREGCPAELEREAVEVMTHLNRQAAVAMVACRASAATDVTGFGLLGHLRTLGVGVEIEASAVPLLPGVRQLAEAGFVPGGTQRNLEAVGDIVDWSGVAEIDRLLLCDAQTSGGLLVAIRPGSLSDFESRMASAAYIPRRIGSVSAGARIHVSGHP